MPILYGATVTLNGACNFGFGADNAGAVLVDGDIGPQGKICQLANNATLIEIGVTADAGTPAVIVQRFRPSGASTVDLTSSQLATGSSGAFACSRATSSTSIDGTATCSGTLQNTALLKGDWIQTKTNSSGAGGVAKRITVAVTWTY